MLSKKQEFKPIDKSTYSSRRDSLLSRRNSILSQSNSRNKSPAVNGYNSQFSMDDYEVFDAQHEPSLQQKESITPSYKGNEFDEVQRQLEELEEQFKEENCLDEEYEEAMDYFSEAFPNIEAARTKPNLLRRY